MAEYAFNHSLADIVVKGPREVILRDKDSNPSRAPSCRISLKFKCTLQGRYWEPLPGPSTTQQMLGICHEEIKDLPDLHVDFEIFDMKKIEENMYKEILRLLSDVLMTECGVPFYDGEDIVGYFVERLQKILDDTPELIRIGSMTFLVDLELIYYYTRVLRELSNDDDHNFMITASNTTIKSLERKRLGDYEHTVKTIEDLCLICLDNMKRNSKICNLPCSHIFHEDCIVKWLNISHYCPTCRFEMPTREADEVCSLDLNSSV